MTSIHGDNGRNELPYEGPPMLIYLDDPVSGLYEHKKKGYSKTTAPFSDKSTGLLSYKGVMFSSFRSK